MEPPIRSKAYLERSKRSAPQVCRDPVSEANSARFCVGGGGGKGSAPVLVLGDDS